MIFCAILKVNMGRKTKKEKIIADLRRKVLALKLSSQTHLNLPPISLSTIQDGSQDKSLIKSNTTLNQVSPLPPTQTQSLYVYPAQLIKKDLTKTILLSILALSLEIGLFFILEKRIKIPVNLNLPINLKLF